MKFLPAARGRAARARRFSVHRDAFWGGAFCVGAGAIALFAGCGAGGEDGPIVAETPDGVGPVLGGGGTNGGGGGIPTAGQNCTAANCDLAGDGQPLATPPGCGDGTLTADEACDDGNRVAGDGCAETCLATEAGFSCAAPGQACRQIARCGDGLVAATEQCDDGNAASGDGCSERCRVELGKKCDGSPSVCTDTTCGDNIKEGAEACDDGNTTPFDGCSPICLKEPNCAGLSCTSDCGDGLVINEDCDDGNLIDGDGCSSTCQREQGFECVAEAACELIGGQCALRVPAIFRDFSGDHPDFGDKNCSALARGAVGAELDAEGRPVIGAAAAAACLSDGPNFAQWYRSDPNQVTNITSVGEVVLFDNGDGGYVNRFGAEGEPFTAIQQGTERQAGPTEASCTTTCTNEAINGNAPFNGALRCADRCRPIGDDIQQLTVGQLNQLNNQLTQAENANPPDPDAIAALEAQIADVQAQIDQLTIDLTTCQTDCQTELDARVATCVPSCKPCGGNPAMFCLGGVIESYDGTPLFFPVDGNTTGPTANFGPASIPDAYGYDAFPFESTVFPGAPDHNFYFTSEVQYWFKYDADTLATLNFLGDDDVWVFLNGRLAVDLGGIHVPSEGSVTINAAAGTVNSTTVEGRPASVPVNTNATTTAFNLEVGNVYKITVFHAERQVTGSSFKLTLAGFEATPSDCTAICGDGVLSFGEECDDGVNDGGYGECNPGCVLGPFCGDNIRQPEFGEDCDVGPGGDGLCRGCRQIQLR